MKIKKNNKLMNENVGPSHSVINVYIAKFKFCKRLG